MTDLTREARARIIAHYTRGWEGERIRSAATDNDAAAEAKRLIGGSWYGFSCPGMAADANPRGITAQVDGRAGRITWGELARHVRRPRQALLQLETAAPVA